MVHQIDGVGRADLPASRNPKPARCQGADSAVSATGLIVPRGHERVLCVLDKSRHWGGCDAYGAGLVVAPGPSARCMNTLSSHRSNL
jgi:hypothetical protein